MKILSSLLLLIGSIFTSLMKQAEKTYNKLPEDVQNSLVHGSGVIALINSMLDKTPAIVLAAIQEKFPDIDIIALEKNLPDLAVSLGVSNLGGLEGCIASLQTKFESTNNGKVWEGISFAASGILAVLFAPTETKFAAISSLLEFVYHSIVKPKIQEQQG